MARPLILVAALGGVAAALIVASKGRAPEPVATRPRAPAEAQPVRAPLAFSVGEPSRAGRAGDELDVGTREARFSYGSRVQIEAGGRARVDALDADGAALTLHEGLLDARIVHAARTRWQVRAGDYAIRVVGTRFAATWAPGARKLNVRLFEGAVEVSGPDLPATRVAAGQRLEVASTGAHLVARRAGRAVVRRRNAAAAARRAAGTRRPRAARASATAGAIRPPGAATARRSPPWATASRRAARRWAARTWSGWATSRGLRAIPSARRRRTGARCAASPPRIGRSSRWACWRSTFVTTTATPRAGSRATWTRTRAARWRPRPAGRLLESLQRAGDTAAAHEAAASYLQRYPACAQAALARRVLDR